MRVGGDDPPGPNRPPVVDVVLRVLEREVDALISACPWSERPLTDAGTLEVIDLFELLMESAA